MLAFGFLFCCNALKIQKTKQFEFVRFVSLSERLMKNICIARSMDINFRSYGFVLDDLVRISLGIVSIQFEPLLTFIHFNFTLKQKQLPKILIINKKSRITRYDHTIIIKNIVAYFDGWFSTFRFLNEAILNNEHV